jgi:hypothetical protein
MDGHIFACLSKKRYNYQSMKKTLLLLTLILAGAPGFSQSHKYQSVFIYSFTRYVQWPEGYNQGDFEILVLGDCPILEELKAMATAKKVQGERNIKVTKINSPSEIRKCNMLYVPATKSNQLDGVIAKVNTQSILIITEEPGMGVKGSDINFIVKDGKLAFEINQAAVNKQNLKVSIELTRLAILI